MEQQNLSNEAVKSSRRRISSILKAPRTSMKLAEQEEEKEEITKPVEKKRNSRRVSFATTNNVRLFTNDAKNESPVLASIQNTHVGDTSGQKILRFVDEGSHQIKGLESLLNTPLYLSQRKENFFLDPVLQDDCVDRTILLGEDTGCMDITHSHTITIDKDNEFEEEANPNFSFKAAQAVYDDSNIANQNSSLREAKAEKKNVTMDSDFSAFLARMSLPTVNTINPKKSEKELDSILCPANTSQLEIDKKKKNVEMDSDFSAFISRMSLPTVNTIKPQKSEKELDTIFCPSSTNTLETDKENHLPSFLMKQHPSNNGNPQQPPGLQRRRSRVSFAEANIEPTTSQTHENHGGVAFMTSAFSNIPDDMELTSSQTAAINFKVTGNITRNVQAALDHSRSHYYSEDDNAMEMTGAFDVSVREKDHTMSIKGQAQSPVPKVRRMSSINVIGNGETADRNKAGYFQSNLSIAQTANSDDMEMTGALDVSVQEQDHTMSMKGQAQPPVLKVRSMSATNEIGNRETTDQNKVGYFQSNLSIAQTANSDDMEMTGALDVSVQDKEEALFPKVSRRSIFDAYGTGEIVNQNKSSNSLIDPTANSDDMEITQCQAIEPKPSRGNKAFSNSRKSLPLACDQECEPKGIMKEQDLYQFPRVNKRSSFNRAGNGVIMDHNKSVHLTIPTTANYDDMEMTQCQSLCLEAKQVSGDKSLNSSKKNWPHTLVSETEGGDGMDMTQMFTGHIILNAHSVSKKEKRESILRPASTASSQRNESDCMDMTCQPRTFAGISSPTPDEMELTGCTTVNIDSNRAWLGSAVDITGTTRANQTITVVEPMEMTEVHMAPFSERKHKAFMTRRKSGARMMSLMCDLEHTGADNCQTDFSNPDNMDMTQCQTIVLEAEKCKRATPFSKSRKSLNVISTSSSPDVDGMEITQALTGNIELKSFASSKKSEHERNLLPTAQSCQKQYESDCMELTCQASASNLAIPCVDDEMELTGCNTIAFDLKSTLAASAAEIKAKESALWASTSVSRCTVSSEEQNEVSEAAKCAINQDFPSKHVFDPDGENLKCDNTMSHGPADVQVDKFCEMTNLSNLMTTDEDDDMQVTKALTMPIEMEQSGLFKRREEAYTKTSYGRSNEEEGEALWPSREQNTNSVLWPNKEQSTSSVQLEVSTSVESIADSFIKEELQNAKARRRSLADFQMELHNISRRIQGEQKVITGSITAPLPSCSLPEQCETEISTEPTSNVTPNVKQKNSSVENEKTTPFSLKKKPFSSRMSLGGIVPKLPKRATAVTPNKTVTISSNDLQCLQLEKHFDVVEQKSSYETVNINDEEIPEMSSEEDMSGSLENWPINKQDELDGSLAVPAKEEPFEDDVFESGTSPCFKRPHPEEDPVAPERTKKAFVSDTGLDCHEAAVQWEGNFTRHAAQNPKAKTIEDTGVSESTLRCSQFDSHMDGTTYMDNVFDFNKKLEDGSIAVNEFLSHFGINFVIHRSRASALPESCRTGETRTMEDLLKEKYIYFPKQRVYEQDCKNLTEIVERLKEQMPEQEKSLRSINEALQQELCTLSKEQLKSFGSKLKERRVFFGKRSKALSHEMKGVLYSDLIKTVQDAKQSLISKLKETDEMMEDVDGCINDLEADLASVEAIILGDHLNAPQTRPALKAKEEDLHRLNSAVTEKQREIGELESQLRTLEGQQEKLRGESSSLKSHLATLNSLNEWRLDATDERGALFTFLHKTVHLQVNLQTPAGKEWMTEDVERKIDVCFQLQLDAEKSECHASMVHKLLAKLVKQTQWTQKYPTTRHIPELLHDISLVVGRLRLLGEEIHRLKKWGGLKLRILKISCTETQVHLIFSSLKAFEKFELSLMVTPDYPFGPLHIEDFRKHMGNARLSQIEDILSSVKPAKNYLTKVLKKIHDDLLC